MIDFICLEKISLYAKIAKQMRKEKISEKVQRQSELAIRAEQKCQRKEEE